MCFAKPWRGYILISVPWELFSRNYYSIGFPLPSPSLCMIQNRGRQQKNLFYNSLLSWHVVSAYELIHAIGALGCWRHDRTRKTTRHVFGCWRHDRTRQTTRHMIMMPSRTCEDPLPGFFFFFRFERSRELCNSRRGGAILIILLEKSLQQPHCTCRWTFFSRLWWPEYSRCRLKLNSVFPRPHTQSVRNEPTWQIVWIFFAVSSQIPAFNRVQSSK